MNSFFFGTCKFIFVFLLPFCLVLLHLFFYAAQHKRRVFQSVCVCARQSLPLLLDAFVNSFQLPPASCGAPRLLPSLPHAWPYASQSCLPRLAVGETQLDSTQLCERKTRPLIISGSSFRFAFLGNAFLGSFRFWFFLFCFFCFFVQFISFVLFSSISGGTIKKHGRTTSQNVPRFVPLLFLYTSYYFLCTFYSGFCCLFTFRNKENK